LRVRLIVAALLASSSIAEACAEQVSVETAAKAAGVAVEVGNATVNGVTIYYRDIGPRA